MKALAGGNTDALGELYRRYADMVAGAVRRFAPHIDDSEVEDLCHDVFLSLRDSAHYYLEQAKFRAWLYGIAVQKARNWKRNGSIRKRLMDMFMHPKQASDCTGDGNPEVDISRRDLIRKQLAALPKGQSDALVLFEVEGFNAAEIGRILGISESNVWTRLHRARKTLLTRMRSERIGTGRRVSPTTAGEVKS